MGIDSTLHTVLFVFCRFPAEWDCPHPMTVTIYIDGFHVAFLADTQNAVLDAAGDDGIADLMQVAVQSHVGCSII